MVGLPVNFQSIRSYWKAAICSYWYYTWGSNSCFHFGPGLLGVGDQNEEGLLWVWATGGGVCQDRRIRVSGPQPCPLTLRVKGLAWGWKTVHLLLQSTRLQNRDPDMSEFFTSSSRQTGNTEGNCLTETRKYIVLRKSSHKSWQLLVLWEAIIILLYPLKYCTECSGMHIIMK